MPFYVYEVIHDDDRPGEQFEVLQSMSDEPLTEHPETGEPVRRVLQPFNVGGSWSDSAAKKMLSDKNLGDKGFTKYVKTETGKYEKTTGKGPKNISAD